MNNDYYSKPSEALVSYLPPYQKKFAQGPTFLGLCDAIDKHLREYNAESKQELLHAKDLFDHFCSIQPDFEREKQKFESLRIDTQKEIKLNSLYLQFATSAHY